ncbi:hypothetical protein [Streptomyces microflavus]|uniref:hypothetical protein n=1 Tax=Streptomyces microflavus TaxID=1919 RepID=UPI002F90DC2F|nr:hypothetical protein OH770_35990 [Streptomyces microflavus]
MALGAEQAGGRGRKASRVQDAVRILFLLDHCLQPDTPCAVHPDAVAVLRGQKKLQALDFWLRNPDYLADELLNVAESERVLPGIDPAGQARTLLAGDEPDLESYPMVRWRFGAYEQLDDALGLLLSHALIGVDAVGTPPEIDRWDYCLLPAGRLTADELRQGEPDLVWYDARAALVLLVAGDRSGSALKDAQYAQAEYERTQLGDDISGISDRVRARLALLENRATEGQRA